MSKEPVVRERPIIFSAPMVKALLAGTKTQTRRIVKWKPRTQGADLGFSGLQAGHYFTGNPEHGWVLRSRDGATWNDKTWPVKCPYGKVGDRLWVREMLRHPDGDPWVYAADNMPVMVDREDETAMVVWAHHKKQDYCTSIHMPRWASRITLEITGVRVERVQDISEEDAKAEGVEGWGLTEAEIADIQISDDSPFMKQFAKALGPGRFSSRAEYGMLWSEINGPKSWDENPWVWIVEFCKVSA